MALQWLSDEDDSDFDGNSEWDDGNKINKYYPKMFSN